ncbi:BPTI/Kunitz domain-containing protein-like [Pararge aegeria]|uniref:BPTI/Kunitz domain-containing protein-like n=1 Tax=Pararge aegeria TaxID=116150 RepID=UPI0019D0C139|nr:BPTI/Kunitz domain-containing protein-like [Pararge aegeria]
MLASFASISAVYFIVYNNVFVEAKISYATYRNDVTRATLYRPYVIAKTCLLEPDRGPCRAEIPMYYFSPSHQTCSIFEWGGCQGNGNRFDTIQECSTTCLSRPNHPKTRPKWCSLTFDYGFCFGALNRWYYDPLWKVCKQRIYSGCGGNKNNFYNQQQCDAVCRYGTGVIRTAADDRSGIKKVLIVNSFNATTRKGRDQVFKQQTLNY